MKTVELDPEIVAQAIGIPIRQWPGRCHEIAGKALKMKLVRGRLSYGHFIGKIATTGHFAGRSFAHHGWIELGQDSVWDPTRWVFEDVEPYIFVGPIDDYDFGGNFINSIRRPSYPSLRVEPGTKPVQLKLASLVLQEIKQVTRDARFDGLVDPHQLHWLANVDITGLSKEAARTLYGEIIRVGWSAHIPYDNRERIVGRRRR